MNEKWPGASWIQRIRIGSFLINPKKNINKQVNYSSLQLNPVFWCITRGGEIWTLILCLCVVSNLMFSDEFWFISVNLHMFLCFSILNESGLPLFSSRAQLSINNNNNNNGHKLVQQNCTHVFFNKIKYSIFYDPI